MTPHSPPPGVFRANFPSRWPAWRPERWLAHLVGWCWGASTARRGLRLATRLYATSSFQTRWRRSRFLIRTLWYGRSSTRWYAFLDANAFRRRLTRLQPALAERPHRPYRRCDLGAHERVAGLVSHGLALERLGWQALVLQMGAQPVTLAAFIGKDGANWRLLLNHPGQFMKEGELCLHLCSDAVRLYSAAFSLVGAADRLGGPGVAALDIGCVQGCDDPAARALVRGATKSLHGLRPRDLMVTALKSLAEAAHAPTLVGVTGSRHVYRHWRKRRQIAFDYDSFWADQGGQVRGDGDFEMSAACTPKPIEEVSSNKRAEARRRSALTADICRQIAAAVRGSEAVAQADEHAVASGHQKPGAVAPRREHTAGHADAGPHQHVAEPMAL
jgi:uncharacterized protein